MLKKEDIIIKAEFPFLHENDFEYDENISDLCDLSNQIIEKHDIKTLSNIEIYYDSLFKKELGQAICNFTYRTSKIILHWSVFSDFNRKEQKDNHQRALATIYHEFYHIYDKENYWDMFLTRLPNNDKTYFQTGSKYWGEFYAYYKSGEIYVDEYVVNEVTKLYSKSKTKKLDESEQQSYFYFISKFIAFSLNDKCKFKLPNNKMLTFMLGDNYYKSLSSKLSNILENYPHTISIDQFIDLGKSYMNIENALGLYHPILIPL